MANNPLDEARRSLQAAMNPPAREACVTIGTYLGPDEPLDSPPEVIVYRPERERAEIAPSGPSPVDNLIARQGGGRLDGLLDHLRR
jgi:hypothetical protein